MNTPYNALSKKPLHRYFISFNFVSNVRGSSGFLSSVFELDEQLITNVQFNSIAAYMSKRHARGAAVVVVGVTYLGLLPEAGPDDGVIKLTRNDGAPEAPPEAGKGARKQ